METKLKKVNEFLSSGHKVKMTIVYRGREMAHRDLGFKLADRLIERFGDDIAVDSQPQMLGKQLHFVIRSSNHAKAKNA
jgi:translation initiation factor IF-3